MPPLASLGYPLHSRQTQPVAYGKSVDTARDKHCADASQPLQQLFACWIDIAHLGEIDDQTLGQNVLCG